MSEPNAPYDDGWFYADGEKPVGPVTSDDLNAVLRAMLDPSKVRVWRAGFPDWRETKDVPEFANQISRPPPLKPAPAPVAKQGDDEKAVQTNNRGHIAAAIVLVIALIVGAVISSIAYGNSPSGIAYLIGQFLGAAGLLFLLTLPWRRARRATYTGAVVLAIATLSLGLSNAQKILDTIAAKEAKAALKF